MKSHENLTPLAFEPVVEQKEDMVMDYKLLYGKSSVLVSEYAQLDAKIKTVTQAAIDKVKQQNQPFENQFNLLLDAYVTWWNKNKIDKNDVSEDKVITDGVETLKKNMFDAKYTPGQSKIFFETIKLNLEKIWFKLQDQRIALIKRQGVVKGLCVNFYVCAPGLYTYIDEALFNICSTDSLAQWLAVLRTNIIHEYSEDHIKKSRQANNGGLLAVPEGNTIHVRNGFLNYAFITGLAPLSSAHLISDHYIGYTQVEQYIEDFDRVFMSKYTLESIGDNIYSKVFELYRKKIKDQNMVEENGWLLYSQEFCETFTKYLQTLEIFTVADVPIFELDKNFTKFRLNSDLFKTQFYIHNQDRLFRKSAFKTLGKQLKYVYAVSNVGWIVDDKGYVQTGKELSDVQVKELQSWFIKEPVSILPSSEWPRFAACIGENRFVANLTGSLYVDFYNKIIFPNMNNISTELLCAMLAGNYSSLYTRDESQMIQDVFLRADTAKWQSWIQAMGAEKFFKTLRDRIRIYLPSFLINKINSNSHFVTDLLAVMMRQDLALFGVVFYSICQDFTAKNQRNERDAFFTELMPKLNGISLNELIPLFCQTVSNQLSRTIEFPVGGMAIVISRAEQYFVALIKDLHQCAVTLEKNKNYIIANNLNQFATALYNYILPKVLDYNQELQVNLMTLNAQLAKHIVIDPLISGDFKGALQQVEQSLKSHESKAAKNEVFGSSELVELYCKYIKFAFLSSETFVDAKKTYAKRIEYFQKAVTQMEMQGGSNKGPNEAKSNESFSKMDVNLIVASCYLAFDMGSDHENLVSYADAIGNWKQALKNQGMQKSEFESYEKLLDECNQFVSGGVQNVNFMVSASRIVAKLGKSSLGFAEQKEFWRVLGCKFHQHAVTLLDKKETAGNVKFFLEYAVQMFEKIQLPDFAKKSQEKLLEALFLLGHAYEYSQAVILSFQNNVNLNIDMGQLRKIGDKLMLQASTHEKQGEFKEASEQFNQAKALLESIKNKVPQDAILISQIEAQLKTIDTNSKWSVEKEVLEDVFVETKREAVKPFFVPPPQPQRNDPLKIVQGPRLFGSSPAPAAPAGNHAVFMQAIKDGKYSEVTKMLKANKGWINMSDAAGNYPITVAIENRQLGIAAHLQDKGANMRLVKPNGESVVLLVMKYFDFEQVKSILDTLMELNPNEFDKRYLLQIAQEANKQDIIKYVSALPAARSLYS